MEPLDAVNMEPVLHRDNMEPIDFGTVLPFQQMEGQVALNIACETDTSTRKSVDDRQLATRAVREYWALKKREERARKRVADVGNQENSDTPKFMRSRICRHIERCWKEAIHGIGVNDQRHLFQDLLQLPTFKDLQPIHSGVERSILSNIQNTLMHVKVPRTGEELFFKRSACMMMVNSERSQQKHVNFTKAAEVLGIHRRNLVAANLRLQLADDGVLPLQTCQRQPHQSSILTDEVKDLIFAFWMSETRVSPNKKDVCNKRLGRKSVMQHPIHLLDEPQVELYKRFQTQHSQIKISLRSFEGIKPFFVRKLKDRYTCCCIAHVQMMFFKDSFNHMRHRSFQLHGPHCKCRCVVCSRPSTQDSASNQCLAHECTHHSMTDLWESVLCSKPPSSEFHAKPCLLGSCIECGPTRLKLCPHEVCNNELVLSVKVFEDIQTEHYDDEGHNKKRKDLIVKALKVKDFISLFQGHIASFIKHNFIVRWQAQQFKNCLAMFPNDVVISVIDFAENYSFKEQNEIQSMHWYSSQVTILVHITYIRNASNEVQKFIHFYVSDDKNHDTLFVQHCLLLHAEWLKQNNWFPKRHWVWSDGAASQFKAKRPFYFVARYFCITNIDMMWSFFGSGHGKGEHDGAGAVIKRTLTHEQLKANSWILKSACDVVAFLQHRFCSADNQGVRRIFWEVKESDVPRERKWDCKPVKGSRSMHCVNGYSTTDNCSLRSRKLSCFCYSCMCQRWARCSNVAYVEQWDYIQITPEDNESLNTYLSDEEGEDFPLYAGHHDALSDALCVGDNFATNTTEKDADFYLLKCTTRKYKTTRALKDGWGNCASANTYVVEGYYYEKVDGETDLYYIPTTQPLVILPSHLVRAIKFDMECVEGESNLFRLSPEIHENIYNSMPISL